MNLLKKLIFNYRYKKAIKQAQEAATATGRKHLVILFKGKPIVMAKRKLNHLVRTKKFAKGVSVADIEKQALFITPPKYHTSNTSRYVSER